MRVAVRRPDGAWDFTQPRQNLGLNSSKADFVAIPSRGSCSRSSISCERTQITKEDDDTTFSRDTMEHDVEPLDPAPPAYGQEYGTYIDHVKEH